MLTKNLSVISRYCHWYMRKMLGESQLSGIDPVILSFLRGKEGTCQDCLCTFLLLDKATMAKAAARLEEKGYITRAVNDKNKREKLLRLTESGQELLQKIEVAKEKWEGIYLRGFSEEERETFLRLSARAAQNAVEYRMKKEID